MVAAVNALREHGAAEVYCAVTHPLLSGPAAEVLAGIGLAGMAVTDTVPVDDSKRWGGLTVLSVASLLGEAIQRIHNDESVGAMFEVTG